MKMKIGFFDFAGCEGCQLTVMNLEEQLLQVLPRKSAGHSQPKQ